MLSADRPTRHGAGRGAGRRMGRARSLAAAILLAVVVGPIEADAQTRNPTTKVGSTLRWGTGLLDVPVAGVLPDRTWVVGYSGFRHTRYAPPEGDPRAGETDHWSGDLSVAYGFWDLLELGGNVQSLESEGDGGSLWGLFGRLTLVHAEKNGLGLAVGGRWSSAPDYGDGVARAPGRLGVADPRITDALGEGEFGTGFSFYSVASFDLRGPESRFFPSHDWTLTGGWGAGLFAAGRGYDWYAEGGSGGWFGGAAMHMQVGRSVLTLEGEYDGFDVNAGATLDVEGFRVGVHVLGADQNEDHSLYRSRKFGVSASVALCGLRTCRPRLAERVRADTVQLPAPPPDTIRVEAGLPPLPAGRAESLCLGTGAAVDLWITNAGDTLLAESRRSISELRPVLDWAGEYAGGRGWFEAGDPLLFDEVEYQAVAGLLRLPCPTLLRVGEFEGVPVFGTQGAAEPYRTLYVPVRPGVWRAYQWSG